MSDNKNDTFDFVEIIKSATKLLGLIDKDTIAEIIRKPGFVHDRTEAQIQGMDGFLVWDYLLYNEIYFETLDGKMISFYSSISDEETKRKWDKLVELYGVRK